MESVTGTGTTRIGHSYGLRVHGGRIEGIHLLVLLPRRLRQWARRPLGSVLDLSYCCSISYDKLGRTQLGPYPLWPNAIHHLLHPHR